MFRTLNRTVAAVSLLAGLALPSVVSAQSETSQNTTFRFGTATLTVRALPSGQVFVGVWRGGVRVVGNFDPAAIDAWATEAATILAAEELHASRELVTSFLVSGATSAITVDRRDRNGESVINLYVGDQESRHNLYLPLTRASATEFIATLQSAAQLSRQLAGAATGPSQGF